MQPDFYLLTAPNCGLCQEAIRLIHTQSLAEPIALHVVDITSQSELLEEYQHLIPVLIRDKDDAELRWPFGDQLVTFLTHVNE